MVESITSWIESHWLIPPSAQKKIFYSLVVIVVLWLVRFGVSRFVFRKSRSIKGSYTWNNAIKNTYYVLLIVIISAIWIDRFDSVATYFGLLSAGLAIALQSPIVNLAGWLFLIVRKPFAIGDRIEVDGNAGDVIDIRFFQFTLNEIGNWVDADQSTGRIIHIPNGKVFTASQANYTQGFLHIWNEISVMVTFESNWEKTKEILNEIVNKHATHFSKAAEKSLLESSRKYMILYRKLTPIVYTSVKDSGVNFTMRYLINPRRRRGSEEAIWEDVLRAFAQHSDIDLAYPTQRIYYNAREGKPGAGGPAARE